MPDRLSVLIPTFNEELNLADCLRSLGGWAGDVWVVDSHSTDRTREIAGAYGAKVVEHDYEGPAPQKNWALENLPFEHEWVLILDADERVGPELSEEIGRLLAEDGAGHDGFYLNRRFIFYGRWIRHCGWYPSWNLRLFRHRLGRYEDREIHEHVLLDGRAGHCRHDLIHEDLRDMTSWIEKHNRYSTHEAREMDRTLRGEKRETVTPSFWGGGVQRKRFIKERVWPYVPGKALVFFLYLYVARLGFLDGRQGLHFCVMQAIFQQFNAVKLWELRHYKRGAPAGGISVEKLFKAPERVKVPGAEKG